MKKIIIAVLLLSCNDSFIKAKDYVEENRKVLRDSLVNVTKRDRALIAYGELLAREINDVDFDEEEIEFILEGFKKGMNKEYRKVSIEDSSIFFRNFSVLLREKQFQKNAREVKVLKEYYNLFLKEKDVRTIGPDIAYQTILQGALLEKDIFEIRLSNPVSNQFYNYQLNSQRVSPSFIELLRKIGSNGKAKVVLKLKHLDFLYFQGPELENHYVFNIEVLK